jgi:hypothetical protein
MVERLGITTVGLDVTRQLWILPEKDIFVRME